MDEPRFPPRGAASRSQSESVLVGVGAGGAARGGRGGRTLREAFRRTQEDEASFHPRILSPIFSGEIQSTRKSKKFL